MIKKYTFENANHGIEKFKLEYSAIKDKINKIFNMENALILLKEKDKVILGSYKNGQVDFNVSALVSESNFIDIRVFNGNRELYIWKAKDGIKGRYISENGNEVSDFFDEKLMLWGNVRKVKEDSFALVEEKINPIVLPNIEGIKENSKIYLKIRNYLFENEDDGVPYIKYWRAIGITE